MQQQCLELVCQLQLHIFLSAVATGSLTTVTTPAVTPTAGFANSGSVGGSTGMQAQSVSTPQTTSQAAGTGASPTSVSTSPTVNISNLGESDSKCIHSTQWMYRKECYESLSAHCLC